MKAAGPKKRKSEQLQLPSQGNADLSPEDWEEFERGVVFFNSGQFKHSQEAWEQVGERRGKNGHLFFQGMIQFAEACQQLAAKQGGRSAINNFSKAHSNLQPFQPEYLGVFIPPLLAFIEAGKSAPGGAADFYPAVIPKIQFHKPGNPDLMVELCEILRSVQFLEGVKLFNTGYFWEAHEAWESVWRDQEGDAKAFTQAFVEMATACTFVKLGKIVSAKYLFEKTVRKLQEFEKLNCGIPLPGLVQEIQGAVTLLQTAPPIGKTRFNPPKIPLT